MIGLVVLGASGSGKTSFCVAMKSFAVSAEEYPIFINLDPGNNIILYDKKSLNLLRNSFKFE